MMRIRFVGAALRGGPRLPQLNSFEINLITATRVPTAGHPYN